jgi:acetyl-CoA carboxylase, biotin carboxylase subunit
MFTTVLIANRGEIALRVARTCRELGIRTVAVHSTADRDSAVVDFADESVQIGPPAPQRSYLNAAAIVEAALRTRAEAIHPGYGFLSEDPDFAEACEAHGLTFIGPPSAVIARLGDKARARHAAAGLPMLPGTTEPVENLAEARDAAGVIGYPLIIKAVAGGGGRGISVVADPADLPGAYAATRSNAQAIFADSRVYLERFLEDARHVEVQILADRDGNTVHLGARDCSVQRRRQKLVEETPPPGLPSRVAEEMGNASVRCARNVGYVGAGTFEFLVDAAHRYYFMEVNCRIQVEHPVTELVTGVDMVREQLRIAAGEHLSFGQADVRPHGASVECRINAEDPARGFLPTPGRLTEFLPPGGPFTRVDTHVRAGTAITPDYDSLLAKLAVWAPDRVQAIARMRRALAEFRIAGPGVCTTRQFLLDVLGHPGFTAGTHTTALVDAMLVPVRR